MIFCIFFAALAHAGSAAAYIQYKDCMQPLAASGHPVANDPLLKPDDLSASLTSVDGSTQLELEVVGSFSSSVLCHDFLRQHYSVSVTLDALGGLQRYQGDVVNASCYHAPWMPEHSDQTGIRLTVTANVNQPPPLAAFQMDTEIRGAGGLTAACLTAFLTPSIGATMYQISFWGPLTVLFSVLLAAGLREMLNMGRVDEETSECNAHGTSRAHLTRIADCLSYIQFIFFSGALNLNYPGFLQPVAGSTSWATLMLSRGVIVQDSLYDGVAHGIYEINGTFGGTTGLELMTQIIGAPVNRYTWTNVIAHSLLILLVLFLVIRFGSSVTWTRDWFVGSSTWALQDSVLGRQKATVWVVLRVFLSYFLLPIVAWTAYQLLWAGLNPTYYSIVSAIVIILVVIACWWGLSRNGPENMGYLLIDSTQDQQASDAASHTNNVLVIATFGLLFARGAATGALQTFGTVQLIILIVCEVANLGLIIWVRHAPGLRSGGILMAGARLCGLLLSISMIPGLSSLQVRSGVGYAILSFHALVLIALFLVPSLYGIVGLAYGARHDWRGAKPSETPAQLRREERPQIYGLRQLHRRPTTQTNLVARPNSSSEDATSSSNDSISNGSSLDSGPMPPDQLKTYFRSPRPGSPSMAAPKRSQQYSVGEASFSSSREPEALGQSQNDFAVAPHQLPVPSPSSPHVDYSFREADLYYVRPRRVSFRGTETENFTLPAASALFLQKIKSWAQWT